MESVKSTRILYHLPMTETGKAFWKPNKVSLSRRHPMSLLKDCCPFSSKNHDLEKDSKMPLKLYNDDILHAT